MRKISCLLIAVFFSAPNVFSADYSYSVQGYGDSGYAYGEIEASSASREVEGQLYDENGDAHDFQGEWVGNGEIEGSDDDGNSYRLTAE